MNLKSLKPKLIFIISLLLLIMVAGSSFFSYWQAKNILNDSIQTSAVNTVTKNAEIFSASLKDPINTIKNISINKLSSQKSFINSLDSATIKTYYWGQEKDSFNDLVQNQKYLDKIFVADLNGNYISTAGKEKSIADHDFFQKTIKEQNLVISEPFTDNETGNRCIAITRPVLIGNQLQIIIGGTIKLNYLQELTKDMKIQDYGYSWIINNNLTTIVHPDPKRWGQKLNDYENYNELKTITTEMLKGKIGVSFYNQNGIEKEVAYAPIENTDWSLAITADRSDLLKPLTQMRKGNLIAVLITLLIGIIITYFLTAQITNPLVRLSNVAEEVAAGNLNQEIGLEAHDKDEIGRLVAAIQTMIKNLSAMIKQVAEVSEKIGEANQNLSTSGQQISKNAEEVGSAIENIASGAEEQSANVDETAENVKGLIEQIEKVDNNTSNMTDSADKMMTSIEKGDQAVNISINDINDVKVKTEEISDIINNLGDNSQKIGNIVELINGIAAQTNLLALNAAIEAARAGEAGRGFSVVADEIRELAENSAGATDDIAALIKEIQKDVNKTVNKIDDNNETVDTAVKAINNTGNMFEDIEGEAEKLKALIEDIALNAGSMSKESQNVKRAVDEIATVSQEFAGSSEEVAAFSQEQIAATEDIVASTKKLAEMSDQMLNTVQNFKF